MSGDQRPQRAATMHDVPQDEQAETQREPATREASRARCNHRAAAITVLEAGFERHPNAGAATTRSRATTTRASQGLAARGRHPQPVASQLKEGPLVGAREINGTRALEPGPSGHPAAVGKARGTQQADDVRQVTQDNDAEAQREPATREASRARCSNRATATIASRAAALIEGEKSRRASLVTSNVRAEGTERLTCSHIRARANTFFPKGADPCTDPASHPPAIPTSSRL